MSLIIRSFVLHIFLTTISFSSNFYQADTTAIQKGYPVEIEGDTLFYIYTNLGAFSAKERAVEVNRTLKEILTNENLLIDSIKSFYDDRHIIIAIDNTIIMSITPKDASVLGRTIEETAYDYIQILKTQLIKVRTEYSGKSIIKNAIFSVLLLSLLIAIVIIIIKITPKLTQKIIDKNEATIKSIKVKGKIVVKASSIVSLIILIMKAIKLIIILLALYFIINEIFHTWPYTRKWQLQPIIGIIIQFIFFTIVLISAVKGINLLRKVAQIRLRAWKQQVKKPIGFKSIELIPAEKVVEIFIILSRVVHIILLVLVSYFYITLIFSFFSFSRGWSAVLLEYILSPLIAALNSVIKFLPNLFAIIVIALLFYYLIKIVRLVFSGIDQGTVTFSGFYKEWAMPTYKIIRFLIIVLAVIIIFPYLPGSDSPFFQGISVFLGILFSLGSSSAIANIVAGVVLTYMRPFKIGDRVKIADTTGDIIERTLLVTRVRTIKNVDITIPNSMVLGSHIINFSSSAQDKGLILHTTITIGYDVPWKKVHELLISAAVETENILKNPEPFVFQTSLDDNYVSYELNVFTNEPSRMGAIYSELHSKIQDRFNEAGVEILSPQYSAVRDGNQTTIPENYLPKEYKAPAFRFFGLNLSGKKED